MLQSVVIIATDEFSVRIIPILREMAVRLVIRNDEFEQMYDWIVTEALSRFLNVSVNGHISHHYRHDVYRCVYSEIYNEYGSYIDELTKNLIETYNLTFLRNQKVKVLVTYKQIILVRSSGLLTSL